MSIEEKEEIPQHSIISISEQEEDVAGLTITTNSKLNTWPSWVTRLHLIIITIFFIGTIVLSLILSVWPYYQQYKNQNKTYQYEPKTGFRTLTVLVHAALNLLLFSIPYFYWYQNYITKQLRPDELPMDTLNDNKSNNNKSNKKALSFMEKKFYYSYTINDGPGHRIATLGVSVSNILFAMIVLIRYQYYLPDNFKKITETEEKDLEINYSLVNIAFFLGLSTRVFASGVPTFSVKKFPKAHYIFTGLMFITMGFYMTLEVFGIDPIANGIHYCILMRRACCFSYWFNFAGIIIFGYIVDLSALASICELLALLVQEIYIISYINSFRMFDGVISFMIDHVNTVHVV